MSIHGFEFAPSQSFSYSPTLTAMSHAVPEVSIKNIIRMAVRAMRPRHSLATNTTSHIYFVSYYLKMVGVYAQRLAAQVVKFVSVGNGMDGGFIGKLVSHNIDSLAIQPSKVEQPISMPIPPRLPYPTFVGIALDNLNPKPPSNTIAFHSYILPRNWGGCQ